MLKHCCVLLIIVLDRERFVFTMPCGRDNTAFTVDSLRSLVYSTM